MYLNKKFSKNEKVQMEVSRKRRNLNKKVSKNV